MCKKNTSKQTILVNLIYILNIHIYILIFFLKAKQNCVLFSDKEAFYFWNEAPDVLNFKLVFFPANNTCVAAVVHRLVFRCKGGGWTENLTLCLSPFAVLSHFLLFFVLHVQFCKAKSRCTLSQVVHQQHSVTVSYHYVNMPRPSPSSHFIPSSLRLSLSSPLSLRWISSRPS